MNLVRYILLVIMSLLVKLYHVPQHLHNVLKDDFKSYRRRRGGVWLKWNGFWEKVDTDGCVIYRRGAVQMTLDGEVRWSYKQLLRLGSSVISATEDYTSHT